MKIIIMASALVLTFAIITRGEDGIKFENGLSWDQVKQKAHLENKHIFVDCFATWCGPCKRMDQSVYPNSKIGELMGERFISIKLQMDSTANDNDQVKRWYPIVHQFIRDYNIQGYPSYLFFSPEGKLIHQDLGFKNVSDFISLAQKALDPLLQDAAIVISYKAGNKNPQILLQAANIFRKNGNKVLADSIATEYKISYLDKLSDKQLFTKESIKFVSQEFNMLFYNDGLQGRFFRYFLEHPSEVDSLIGVKDFANHAITQMIKWEELTQKLFQNNQAIIEDPNWDSLELNIEKKWRNVISAKKLIADYKPGFYLYTKKWKKWSDLFNAQLNATTASKNGHHYNSMWGDETILNQNAWTVFLRCNDKSILKQALKWVDLAIQLMDTVNGVQAYYDTKANLLYKSGQVKKAIKLEKKAIKLDNYFAEKNGKSVGSSNGIFKEIIKKMEAGQPTWPDNK